MKFKIFGIRAGITLCIALGIALGMASGSAWAADEIFSLDTSKSKVEWIGKKVVGSAHNGEIKVAAGEVTYSKGKPNSGFVTIDMKSIVNVDIKDKKWNKKLLTHLNSADFFDTNKFKNAKFMMKKISTLKTGKLNVDGELEIKGKKLPAIFVATAKRVKNQLTISGNLKFDRTKYGIKYGSGQFFKNLGDKMISDEVELKILLVANKQIKSASQKQ